MPPVSRAWSRPRRRYVALLIVTIGLFILIPQAGLVWQSFAVLRNLQVDAVAGALLAIALTFPWAATSYHFLARRRLVYHRTVLVAVANMFTNRLLPAGVGSMATFFVYLRKRKHTVNQATSVVAVNNFMGFFSHGCLLAALLIFNHHGFKGFSGPVVKPGAVFVFLVLGSGIFAFALSRTAWRRRLLLFCASLSRDIFFYKRFPLRLTGAFLSSTALTIANATSLWFCVQAVHGHLGITAALAVFTFGIIAGTATPTPGGLGGTEAGLLAGLIGYHLPSQTAIAAIVLYRLLSYWLTLAVGGVTYAYVEWRGYLHRFEPAN